MTDTVTVHIPAGVGSCMKGSVFATFLWRADEPLRVALAFATGFRWIIERDVLAGGLRRQVGDPRYDQFLIQPATAGIVIHDIATGVMLVFDREALRDALLKSARIDPIGFVDIEDTLGTVEGVR
jgi:hypothetical protein